MVKFVRQNFQYYDEELTDELKPQEIEEGYVQTLARLFAYNYLRNTFSKIICDVDGRLLVSTEPTKADEATQSSVDVTVAGETVVAANSLRRQLIIQNTGNIDAYITFGDAPETDNAMLLKPNVAFTDAVYIGKITAKTVGGTTHLHVVEMTKDLN